LCSILRKYQNKNTIVNAGKRKDKKQKTSTRSSEKKENKSCQYAHERRHIPAAANFATHRKQRGNKPKKTNDKKNRNDKGKTTK